MTAFNAVEWLAKRTIEARDLSEETFRLVGSLTLIWGYFESAIFESNVNSDRISKYASSLLQTGDLSPAIETAFEFWRNRYARYGAVGPEFDDLFKRPENKEVVAGILLKEGSNKSEKLLAVLFIVQRLRHNLFHGSKPLLTLNDQQENFDNACRALAAAIELSERGT